MKVCAGWGEKEAQKNSFKELTRRLVKEFSAREWCVAEEHHTEVAVAVHVKLTKQVKQLQACVTELEMEAIDGKETVLNLMVNLKAAE